MSEPRPARVLVALLVQGPYPSELEVLASAARLRSSAHRVELLVLDNRNLGPGWTDSLKETCAQQGVEYYRPPRPLGLSRSINLLLGFAVERSHDHLLATEVDALLPANLVDSLVEVARSDPAIASVSAWNETLSVDADPSPASQPLLAETGQVAPNVLNQQTVDWVAGVLHSGLGDAVVDLPHASSSCLLIPAGPDDRAGRLDPIFRHSNSGLVDWSRRTRRAGKRHVLAPGTLVCRWDGDRQSPPRRTVRAAGADTELALLATRYPDLTADLEEFIRAGVVTELARRAKLRIVVEAAARWGYQVAATWLKRHHEQAEAVLLVVPPDGELTAARTEYLGFSVAIPIGSSGILPTLTELVGSPPYSVVLYDRGRIEAQLAEEARRLDIAVVDSCTYPERV